MFDVVFIDQTIYINVHDRGPQHRSSASIFVVEETPNQIVKKNCRGRSRVLVLTNIRKNPRRVLKPNPRAVELENEKNVVVFGLERRGGDIASSAFPDFPTTFHDSAYKSFALDTVYYAHKEIRKNRGFGAVSGGSGRRETDRETEGGSRLRR